MKATEDKRLEKLAHTLMADSTLENTSPDFTTKVMSRIVAPKTSDVYVYKPLIPKFVFIIVFGCLVSLLFFLEPNTNSWIHNLNMSGFYNNLLTSIFNFSKITIYSVVFATVLLFIQISFLKKYFDKQFEGS